MSKKLPLSKAKTPATQANEKLPAKAKATRKPSQRTRAGTQRVLAAAPAPTLVNALPNLPVVPPDPDQSADGQPNLIPHAVQAGGLTLSLPRWAPLADPGEIDTIFCRANGRMIGFYEYSGDDPAPPDPFILTLQPHAELQTHGEKEITYTIFHANGNVAPSDITHAFVDALDPNLNNRPAAITLPTDLSGPVTPDYLAGKPGLVCRIQRMADNRPGDTWQAFFGSKDLIGITGVFPLTGSAEVIFTTAIVLAGGSGDREITYNVTDRGGNETQTSFTRTVTVATANEPVLENFQVLEAPLIDKEEARNGVTVRLGNIVDWLSTDMVRMFWHGTLIYEKPVGVFPIFPLDGTATFDVISSHGDMYNADVHCTISRDGLGTIPSPTITVAVNINEPGDTDNPGPGPVDPNYDPPTVRGNEGYENHLVELDRSFPATVTFSIPSGLTAGVFIDVYYGIMGGTLADTYNVTGSEAPGFEVALEIGWDIIEMYGNGDAIPCYYKVRDAINYKHSPDQSVKVELYSLSGLAEPVFSVLNTVGRLGCFDRLTPPLVPAPWVAVPIFIKDDVALQIGDLVVVHAARYAFADNTTPLDTMETTPREISFNDIADGFTINLLLGLWFRDFTGTGGRGWVGVRWSIYRPDTTDRGTSDEVQVRWDFRGAYPPLGTCVPDSTRALGSL